MLGQNLPIICLQQIAALCAKDKKMNSDILFGFLSIAVSSFFLFCAYTKNQESVEHFRIVKAVFSAGWIVYGIVWVVLIAGFIQAGYGVVQFLSS